jgi:hypothetical protein
VAVEAEGRRFKSRGLNATERPSLGQFVLERKATLQLGFFKKRHLTLWELSIWVKKVDIFSFFGIFEIDFATWHPFSTEREKRRDSFNLCFKE